MTNFSIKLTVVMLLAIFVILTVTTARPALNSGTCDEIAHHIPVGFVLLTKADFKMDTSQPPLPRYIVALPLKLFLNLNFPADKSEWRRPDRSEFGRDFFYKYNNVAGQILFLSRIAVILIGLLCGIILFIWAKSLYGNNVALFSLFLFTFCPNILAHSSLATTDITATCFMLLSISVFWLFTREPSWKHAFFAGICLGLAQLSKYTSVLLYPLFLFLLVFELPKDKDEKKALILQFLAIIGISLFTVWAGYGFDAKPILADSMRQDEKIAIAHNIANKIFPHLSALSIQRLDNFLLNVPFPMGAHVLGLLGILRHSYEGHHTFFLGKSSGLGNPLYFLVAFLIKTPIPMIIFFTVGLFVAFRNKIGRNERFLLATIILFFLTASFSKLQLGLRYILPIYPFCFIIAARGIGFFKKRSFILFLILCSWYVISTVFIWPHCLSYFNELRGGPENGYKYLRDSNLGWGKDLPSLEKYMQKNNISEVTLEYFGQADPGQYGIKFKIFSGEEYKAPSDKVYAISADSVEVVQWTKDYKPTAKAGYSIFIYDFRKPKDK